MVHCGRELNARPDRPDGLTIVYPQTVSSAADCPFANMHGGSLRRSRHSPKWHLSSLDAIHAPWACF